MLNFLRDLDLGQVALLAVLVAILIALCVTMADLFITEPYIVAGEVIGAEYTPASSGIGSGISPDGKPVIVTTHESEKWTLVVDIDGNIKTYEVPPDMYYSVNVGEQIKMQCRKGKILGIVSCFSAHPKFGTSVPPTPTNP